MGREATGELEPLNDGRFAARITIEGRTRKSFTLSACGTDEKAARERCAAMAKLAARMRRAGVVAEIEKMMEMAGRARAGKLWDNVVGAIDQLCKDGPDEGTRDEVIPTFADFTEEWTSGKLHAKHPDHVDAKDASEDKSRLRNYILDHIGPTRIDRLTLADFDNVMANLPDSLEPSTRRHVAQILGRVMRLAVYPGRHIAASPIPRGWLPKPSKPKARSYIYPSEDAKLMAAPSDVVPLWLRLAFGFIAREGTRGPSEALAFRWRHFDLERGAVRLDVNKTDDARFWMMTEGTTRALRAWKKITKAGTAPGDPVFVDHDGTQPHETTIAERLRVALKAVGVTRPELYEHNAHRMKLRAHDLRASFITVALANGKSETWVTDRTGHTTSDQLRNYRRAARTFAELNLGEWTPLDVAIPELLTTDPLPADSPPAASSRSEVGQDDRESLEELTIPAEIVAQSRVLDPLIGVRISAPEP